MAWTLSFLEEEEEDFTRHLNTSPKHPVVNKNRTC